MTGACSHERCAFLQALNPPRCPPESCPLQIRPPIKLRACHAGYCSNYIYHIFQMYHIYHIFQIFIIPCKLGRVFRVMINKDYYYYYYYYIHLCMCMLCCRNIEIICIEIKDSTEYLVFQSVVIIINTKIIQPINWRNCNNVAVDNSSFRFHNY